MWILRTPHPEPDRSRAFRITAGCQKTFGRSGVADFTVDVPMVSRVHCRVIAGAPGILEIEDLDSTNGTFVNGTRVARVELLRGDHVRIGRLELVVDATTGL